MTALIQAEQIEKKYSVGKTVLNVLRGASLSVAAGETVAIIGPSGAGKSTLLHILGGLDKPDRGTVRFDGADLYGMSGARRTSIRARRVGFVFQSYHLLPELSVLENAMLPAMTGFDPIPAARMRERALEFLSAVGLAQRARHCPMELSGGEQQRLALARALMNNPDLILADEPTGNLDDATGRQVLTHLFDLLRRQRHTLLLVTHNEQLARQCDRILKLSDGMIGP